ncbi:MULTISPECIES: ComEA family DNA-binding protein [unclassified Streptomyces]|uniref:ComEA family DNA-binding protein n=1 Tax=unclassified Streptomyces TaxID=2593676 RepID=UPI001BEB4A04|nr:MULTISPECIES: ComEA family DNA-binding protein [unclassified Streptomyces]MBT2404373.1 ComEA family DNA-binding protein [Streptomyces sp. ISL-21]MBT2607076.1 ComEA family DNA-binding protein [Streptomyces sp. ISL-87]
MTTRTRTSHPSGATSGPGRSRLSDGRFRHRRGHRGTHPDPVAVRRRAEALLGGSSPPEAPSPSPSPDTGVISEARPAAPPSLPPDAGVTSEAWPAPPPVPPDDSPAGSPPGEEAALGGTASRSLAVRERLPVWLQARCGVEPRTVAAVGVVLLAAVGFAAQQYWSGRPQPVTAPAVVAPAPVSAIATASAPLPPPSPGAPAGPPAAGSARIVVDVSGKVRDPGIRRLPAGSRVEDALAAAGGVRPGADTTGLNRARVLMDGEQVLVGAPAPVLPGGAGPSRGPLSLGSATVEQLDGLPGVGPVLAQHIVDFRTARGGFRSVEDLRQVNGIGERRFADLRTLVRP